MEANHIPVSEVVEPAQQEGSRVISTAWPPFIERLSLTLAKLQEDQFLIIADKRFNQCVQFSGLGFYGVRIETTSNFYRDDAHQLTEQQITDLLNLGLNAPTNAPDKSTPLSDPDGSPNFFVEFPAPVDFNAVAELAINVLHILQVPHPSCLQYDAFNNTDGSSLAYPELGLKREIRSEDSDQNDHLPELLLATLQEVTGIHSLTFQDGYVGGIDADSVTTFISLCADRQYMRINAVIIKGVKESKALLKRVNEMNGEVGYMHMVVSSGTVIVFSDVLVEPFVASHVATALDNFCLSANSMKIELEAEFGDVKLESEQQSTPLAH